LSLLGKLPRLLLNLPFKTRLCIVGLSFVFCLGIFMFIFPASHNGSSLGIPVALSVWMFKRRGAVISLILTLLALIVVNTITVRSILWPPALLLSFFTGSVAMLVEALIIGFLRYALEMADAATIKAQQAEKALAKAFEQQRQLNQLKDQFLLNVNHELRTPLTEILGYLELLHEGGERFDLPLRETFLKKAIQGCEELEVLVGNVLEAAHAGNDVEPPRRENLPVVKIVNDVLERFDPRKRQEHDVCLDIPEELTVLANEQYMRQVLRNLLSNAFKYSPSGSQVIISVNRYESDCQDNTASDQVCIKVKDVGLGIPPEEIPLLFGKFVRLKRDLSGNVRGSGLGLYVSKQLVEAMGGRIWVESSGLSGEGSSFSFTLPCGIPAGGDVSTDRYMLA
jgi:signal transduction histidine kinase